MNGRSHPGLSLYYFLTCPYCAMVLDCIEELRLKVEKCDILKDQGHLQKLLSDTGSRTVPCLYIDNRPMRESRDIVNWLRENVDKLEKV